jgi:hypothetical protein
MPVRLGLAGGGGDERSDCRMKEPYLLLSFRVDATTPAEEALVAQMQDEVTMALLGKPPTQLKIQDVYVAPVAPSVAFAQWDAVVRILDKYDTLFSDRLEWFVHLADRRGCEFACN